jgi:hypothetical protein
MLLLDGIISLNLHFLQIYQDSLYYEGTWNILMFADLGHGGGGHL